MIEKIKELINSGIESNRQLAITLTITQLDKKQAIEFMYNEIIAEVNLNLKPYYYSTLFAADIGGVNIRIMGILKGVRFNVENLETGKTIEIIKGLHIIKYLKEISNTIYNTLSKELLNL